LSSFITCSFIAGSVAQSQSSDNLIPTEDIGALFGQMFTFRDYSKVANQQNVDRVDNLMAAAPMGIDGLLMAAVGLSLYLQIISRSQWGAFFYTTMFYVATAATGILLGNF